MEFWRTILVLLRRKWVVLPVLLFSLGVATATYMAMPTQYMSTATTVLTTSTNGGTLVQDPTRPAQQINPLFSLDGMKTAASILIQVVNTRDVADQLGAVKGGATTYTVSDGSVIPQLLAGNGPFIVIEGYSTSSSGARNIVVRVEQRLRDELISQQRALKAPPSTFIGMIDVVPPSAPEVQLRTKIEAVAGALVLGLVASTGVAYIADRTRATAVAGASSPDTVAAQRGGALTTKPASNLSVGSQRHRS
ncbi:MAG: hypothetical protein ACRDQY_05975 [Pseudonocardiaceae bacterium]